MPESGSLPTPDGLRLVVIGPDFVRSFPLALGASLRIGRSLETEVSIDDPLLSRVHAAIRYGSDGLSIEDLGSANGTKLRGDKLEPHRRTALGRGDLIEAGRSSMMVHGNEPDTEPLPAPLARRGDTSPSALPSSAQLVVENEAMRELHELIRRIAPSEISVLILGETGVGKEVLAHQVHTRSKRNSGPFLALNCGAFSEELLESELFGHERGAFTGAHKTKLGLLETAAGGTIFLDEIGEMPISLQVKLLRVLEERKIRRVGGLEAIPIDVRFIAATNRDLSAAVELSKFREDLYYRLNGITLRVPPLRERRDEIPRLAQSFADHAANRECLPAVRLSASAIQQLGQYAWPGNIRELKNVVEHAVVLAGGGEITVDHIPREKLPQRTPTAIAGRASDEPADSLKDELEAVERDRILKALDACAGNQTRAAQLLGLSRQALIRRLEQYSVTRPRKR
ncbi:MAG: sigma 54-interacting transcriptional regulator [Deltaproteobacteria bacterium]|nr:sigma 54-interacting transcriptional regulator [Deltaproteobacteria bacterium]